MIWLNNESDLSAILNSSKEKAILFFKHSTQCSRSANAFSELKSAQEDLEKGVTLFGIDVHQARVFSNLLEERLQIRHESPQSIFVKDGNVMEHYSHSSITKERLLKSAKEISAHV